VDDCLALRASAGWARRHPKQVEEGLKNSAFVIAAQDGEKTIGMTRLVSDGGGVYFVVDVLVLPEYQRQGIGKALFGKAMAYVDSRLRDGWQLQVDLMAAKGKEGFYEAFGFVRRDGTEYGSGMMKRIEGKK
jgi:GNAT superfamily N-acetyltransferase